MNIVDLRTIPTKVNDRYMGVPQPMFSYTSTQEFKEYVVEPIKKRGEKVTIITDRFDLLKKADMLKNNANITYRESTSNGALIADVTNLNIWIATGEKHIALACTSTSEFIYKFDSNGKKVETDNTFIKLYKILYLVSHIICYTSSGIFNVSISKWNFTAAVRKDYNQSLTNGRGIPLPYEDRLRKILGGKKPTIKDHAVFNLLMNPLSPTYLEPEATVKTVYKGEVRAKDRFKVIENDRFKDFFIKQLGVLMPDLADEIRKHNTPEDLAIFLKKMRENVLEKGTVDEQIKVLVTTARFGYGKEVVEMEGNAAQLDKYQDVPLLHNGSAPSSMGEGLSSGKVGGVTIEPYNDAEDIKASNVVLDDADMKEMMEETDTISEYIQDDDKPAADGEGI